MCQRRGSCWGEVTFHRRRLKGKLFSCIHMGHVPCYSLLSEPEVLWFGSVTPPRYGRKCLLLLLDSLHGQLRRLIFSGRGEGILWTPAKAAVETCSCTCWCCSGCFVVRRRGSAARWPLRGRGASVWQRAVFTAPRPPRPIVILTLAPKPKQSLNFYLNRKAARFLDRTDSVATNLLLQFKKQTSVWHVPCSSVGH